MDDWSDWLWYDDDGKTRYGNICNNAAQYELGSYGVDHEQGPVHELL